MSMSAKQMRQKREMGAQDFRRSEAKRRSPTFVTPKEKPAPTSGHANVGTDDDVKAYCLRMGYMIEVKP